MHTLFIAGGTFAVGVCIMAFTTSVSSHLLLAEKIEFHSPCASQSNHNLITGTITTSLVALYGCLVLGILSGPVYSNEKFQSFFSALWSSALEDPKSKNQWVRQHLGNIRRPSRLEFSPQRGETGSSPRVVDESTALKEIVSVDDKGASDELPAVQ